MQQHEYTDALCSCMGCRFLSEPTECTCYGKALGVYLEHSEGHYQMINRMARGVQAADPHFQTEF